MHAAIIALFNHVINFGFRRTISKLCMTYLVEIDIYVISYGLIVRTFISYSSNLRLKLMVCKNSHVYNPEDHQTHMYTVLDFSGHVNSGFKSHI